VRDAGAFGGDFLGRSVGEVAKGLEAYGGVGGEEPGKGRLRMHAAILANFECRIRG
jgi:hypothetical protein